MPSIDNDASASTVSSSISLVKTIIGAGLLSMPLAYSTDGIIFGTFIILLAAFTSGFGLFLQCYVSRYVPVKHATFSIYVQSRILIYLWCLISLLLFNALVVQYLI